MLDVVSFKQLPSGKWMAVKCGYAKKNDKGDLNIYLDAIPAPKGDQYHLVVTKRQERQEAPARESYAAGELSDEIPY